MEIIRTGFILYTIYYEKCVSFYKNILGLKVLYTKASLTCFDFYGSYLMVEIDDETDMKVPPVPSRVRTCIRINVSDVKSACKKLGEQSIPYTYNKFDWGEIAKFRDPDGNLIGFRSDMEFKKDVDNNH